MPVLDDAVDLDAAVGSPPQQDPLQTLGGGVHISLRSN